MIKFEIPVRLIIANKLNTMHWGARRKYAAMLKDEVFCAVPYRCNIGAPRAKRSIKILYLTKRLQDPDNFIASLKYLIDAFTKLELIKDDSEKYIQLYATQKVDRKRAYKVMIEIH